ncbi:hypothetical protein BC830DRAFT_491956 [Chytriomyces sp. MP71]|nr:hypothetical protein BC830DRAFT_491956 [Chytriomyces sp. MP71]
MDVQHPVHKESTARHEITRETRAGSDISRPRNLEMDSSVYVVTSPLRSVSSFSSPVNSRNYIHPSGSVNSTNLPLKRKLGNKLRVAAPMPSTPDCRLNVSPINGHPHLRTVTLSDSPTQVYFSAPGKEDQDLVPSESLPFKTKLNPNAKPFVPSSSSSSTTDSFFQLDQACIPSWPLIHSVNSQLQDPILERVQRDDEVLAYLSRRE